MIYSKICGVSDYKTLKFIVNHKYPPKFIGFILNYKKSKRFISFQKLKKLLTYKKKVKYVAVLVNPDEKILKKISLTNKFDYIQLYDVLPNKLKEIKKKYRLKIIYALTIKKKSDIYKYKNFSRFSDIILFDSKGYEKSMAFDHELIKKIKINKPLMIAGDIQINDNIENYKKIADIIDISGGLETSGVKDKSKIDIFLKKVEQL